MNNPSSFQGDVVYQVLDSNQEGVNHVIKLRVPFGTYKVDTECPVNAPPNNLNPYFTINAAGEYPPIQTLQNCKKENWYLGQTKTVSGLEIKLDVVNNGWCVFLVDGETVSINSGETKELPAGSPVISMTVYNYNLGYEFCTYGITEI